MNRLAVSKSDRAGFFSARGAQPGSFLQRDSWVGIAEIRFTVQADQALSGLHNQMPGPRENYTICQCSGSGLGDRPWPTLISNSWLLRRYQQYPSFEPRASEQAANGRCERGARCAEIIWLQSNHQAQLTGHAYEGGMLVDV